MIDEEAPPDARARMNFDARPGARKLRDDAPQREPAAFVQPVRHAMQQHGVEARIAQENFHDAARRRIPAEYRVDLLAYVAEHFDFAVTEPAG